MHNTMMALIFMISVTGEPTRFSEHTPYTILSTIANTALYSELCLVTIRKDSQAWDNHEYCREFRYGLMDMEIIFMDEKKLQKYMDDALANGIIDNRDISTAVKYTNRISSNYNKVLMYIPKEE